MKIYLVEVLEDPLFFIYLYGQYLLLNCITLLSQLLNYPMLSPILALRVW